MVLMGFFANSIITKQFEYSQIKRMCIFHVLTVRGLSDSKGGSVPCMGLPSNAEAPLAMYLQLHVEIMAGARAN